MSQVQALLVFVLAGVGFFVFLGVCIAVTGIVYEVKDRRRRRARPGLVEFQPDSIDHLDWTVR